MKIKEMSNQDCLDLLTRKRLGRLACAQGSQPYVVPIYYVYGEYCLYSLTTIGKKIEWMRANPLVCLEVDDVVKDSPEWTSVIVSGRFEEMPDTPEWQAKRETALKLLQRYAMFWEPALTKTILHGRERPLIPVLYRIRIDEISGRRAIRGSPPAEN
jgi:hypothetical protein